MYTRARALGGLYSALSATEVERSIWRPRRAHSHIQTLSHRGYICLLLSRAVRGEIDLSRRGLSSVRKHRSADICKSRFSGRACGWGWGWEVSLGVAEVEGEGMTRVYVTYRWRWSRVWCARRSVGESGGFFISARWRGMISVMWHFARGERGWSFSFVRMYKYGVRGVEVFLLWGCISNCIIYRCDEFGVLRRIRN